MQLNRVFLLGIALSAAPAVSSRAQTDAGIPHLQKQGSATQLMVDGKPFLVLSGELSNNAATSLESMEPIWLRVVAGNLNTVLVGVSWAQFEPEEGKFDYSLVDGVIAGARANHLHLVLLWFASWKNGTSSYAPYWVKKDYLRFPRIQIGEGKTVSITGPIETLSTFGNASSDADAAAFAALMRHIKEVDGTQHTVLMMQVENEVGVLRDSRDRSPAANRAFAGPVPAELMSYLQAHKDNLIPEFREVWAENGYKTSGTWEDVFGPGKPVSVEIPIQTFASLLGPLEHENSWQHLHWPSDEIFMAWEFARYIGTRHAIAVSNGTAALHLAFLSLQLRDGEEVVTPSFTFAAVANTLLNVRAVPRFADVSSLSALNSGPNRPRTVTECFRC